MGAYLSQPSRRGAKTIGFHVLIGLAAILLDAFKSGAFGGILGFAACGLQASQEVNLAWKDQDWKLAREK
jgi:dihydrodipicolinate synthase/N-acetylneuraminate lyase